MIRPLEMNGIISRTQDVALLRSNEDNKVSIDHANVLNQMETKRDTDAYTVQIASQSDGTDTKHDAKEKSKNEYIDIRKKRKKQEAQDEVVRVKTPSGGFDLKI